MRKKVKIDIFTNLKYIVVWSLFYERLNINTTTRIIRYVILTYYYVQSDQMLMVTF